MKIGLWAKAFCFMGPLFLTPFLDKCGDYLLNGLWPSWQLIVYCTAYGVVQMLIGGRAFFDGSAERAKIAADDVTVTPEPKT